MCNPGLITEQQISLSLSPRVYIRTPDVWALPIQVGLLGRRLPINVFPCAHVIALFSLVTASNTHARTHYIEVRVEREKFQHNNRLYSICGAMSPKSFRNPRICRSFAPR